MMDFGQARESFQKSLGFIERHGISTFDPYDIKTLKLLSWTLERKSALRLFVRYSLYSVFFVAPLVLRRLLRVQPLITAEGVAFLAEVYREYYEYLGNEGAKQKAFALVEWLVHNSYRVRDGIGWGVPYRWTRGRLGSVPPNFPNAHTTAVCVDVLLDFLSYDLETNTIQNVIRDALHFLANGLFSLKNSSQKECFSYTPLDQVQVCVVNTNADMAWVFLKAAVYVQEEREAYFALGKKLLWFVISEQQDNGSWNYFARSSEKSQHIDGYHTAMILRALTRSYILGQKSLGKDLVEALEVAIRKGVQFYVSNLFTMDGRPKFTPSRVYPVDILSCAMALITLSEVYEIREEIEGLPPIKPIVERVLSYSLRRMQQESGEFYYRDYGIKRMRLGSLRWAQAPMSLGILKALRVIGK